MTSTLKEKLQYFLKIKNTTPYALEKEAGLPHQSLYNILVGRSKNPKLDIIVKIANFLDCSVDEIIGRNCSRHVINNEDLDVIFEDPYLFKLICIYVSDFINTNFNKFSLKDAVLCIEEIYKYSIENKITYVDTRFADWFLNKTFKS